MASLCNKGKSWFIIHYRNKKRQPMIYLGDVSESYRKTVLRNVEELVSAKISGAPIAQSTAKWLAGIDSTLREKLAKAGLIEMPEELATTLDAFIEGYIDKLSVKEGTEFNLQLTRRNLVEFFGADKRLKDITPGDADDFRRWLAKQFSDNTVRRRCGRAKQFFRAAVRKKLIPESPFGDMKGVHVTGNGKRDYFLTAADAAKVLDYCPGTQWKLLFALVRFGGLRCPSEVRPLKWSDIDFAAGRMTVYSPKTEHHEGRDSRVIPIFPELRTWLEDAKLVAEPKAEYVITLPSIRNRGGNVGTQLARYVKRAGLTVWPKLFQNMRATRQTELTQQGFAEHVVCAWLGNTQTIARKHYLKVTDADFEKAVVTRHAPEEAQPVSTSQRQRYTWGVAASGLLSQIVKKALKNSKFKQHAAAIGKLVQSHLVTPTGLKQLAKLLEKLRDSE